MLIRDSRIEDLTHIQAIYAHHVLHGLASFEEEPPDVEELGRRRADVLGRGLPHLVAEQGGRVLGFAYAGPYRLRRAYRFTVEDSIYVSEDCRGMGVGRGLLSALVERSTAAGCRQMIAVIGDSGNAASIGLHASLGFVETGILRSVGFKFGRWVDSVLMQRPLGPGGGTLPA
ncbi:MAG TPA: GNAT family N-acetyltransferase [Azospirillum sp.]|nr:GNAT family N-acetyltransferase [Azospirillum sp.]